MQMKLGTLNAYQIAGLAVLTSTAAAITVLLAMRRFAGRTPVGAASARDSAPGEAMAAQIPHHFSENLLVPGFTETGAQVLEDDDRLGRSPEGV